MQLRHAGRETEGELLSYRDLVLDKTKYQVRVDGIEISKITKQEFAILELLVRHPKQVFSKEDIFTYAWMSRIWERQRRWMFISVIFERN